MAKKKPDDRVTKRRVTMRSVTVVPGMTGPDGEPVTQMAEAVDYVRHDFLDAYVADAETRWQSVQVSAEPDAGPAGYDGPTYVSPRLDHPLAGTYFPATDCGPGCTHAPDGARVVIADQEG